MNKKDKCREKKIEIEERIQKEKLEKEETERERQFDLRMKETEMQNKTVKPQPLDFGIHFDVTKHRFVPPFQEKEVDRYFLHFEKVAETFKRPKEHWGLSFYKVL